MSENKLGLLLKVKDDLLNDKRENHLCYICASIHSFYDSCGYTHSNSKNVITLDIAKRVCRELHIKLPVQDRTKHIGWWEDYDYKTRLAVVNRLIKETKLNGCI